MLQRLPLLARQPLPMRTCSPWSNSGIVQGTLDTLHTDSKHQQQVPFNCLAGTASSQTLNKRPHRQRCLCRQQLCKGTGPCSKQTREPEHSAIDPDTVCVGCGQDSSPDTVVICDSCEQGFQLACFGMPQVPDTATWVCLGCSNISATAPTARGRQPSSDRGNSTAVPGQHRTPSHTEHVLGTMHSLGPTQKDCS